MKLNWPVLPDTVCLPLGCNCTPAPCRVACAESVASPVMIPLRSWAVAAPGVIHIANAMHITEIAHAALRISQPPVCLDCVTESQPMALIGAFSFGCWRSLNEGSEYQGNMNLEQQSNYESMRSIR